MIYNTRGRSRWEIKRNSIRLRYRIIDWAVCYGLTWEQLEKYLTCYIGLFVDEEGYWFPLMSLEGAERYAEEYDKKQDNFNYSIKWDYIDEVAYDDKEEVKEFNRVFKMEWKER